MNNILGGMDKKSILLFARGILCNRGNHMSNHKQGWNSDCVCGCNICKCFFTQTEANAAQEKNCRAIYKLCVCCILIYIHVI